MLPTFLVPETEVRQNGSAEPFMVPTGASALLVTLGITHILEQESLDLTIYGSADGATWTAKPLLAFAQKFYCGTYQMLLDLTTRPDLKQIQVRWHLNRWGRGGLLPFFEFYVYAEDVDAPALRAKSTSAA
jgi:hypothetical protein